MGDFLFCLAETARHEGGFSNHAADPGGATNLGVTQATFDAYLTRRGEKTRPVRSISRDEAVQIYRDQFWRPVRGDALPEGLDLAVYDFGVNSGPPRAVKSLQAALGVTPDGQIGEVTLAAIRNRTTAGLVRELCERRIAFMKVARAKGGGSAWAVFGTGWARRVAAVYAVATLRCGGTIDRAFAARTFGADAVAYADRWVRRYGHDKTAPVPPRPAPAETAPEPADLAPTGDAKALPAPATQAAGLDKALAAGGAVSTIVATLAGAVSNPYALGALVIVAGVAGVLVWRLWPRAAAMPELTT